MRFCPVSFVPRRHTSPQVESSTPAPPVSRPDLNTSTLAEAMSRHPQPLAQSTAADVEPSDRHK